ncbi:alpha-1,2-fucosyltransferase [Neorhizobium galegae]|uniref:Glycosyltransferase, family 11 n=1 Tax=Neorhizobium galegae bv. orientalis str. HAMBI 540 TaxID=1028800 RepID=A0A068SZG9_NEOGA|nr:alpha-1,2-fucosyltransferase [Neorhizobium galegae]MCQ1852744.1 alpha-1,2-fucosyltransferase [Neorhizobium galegae]CDN51206.1 Glycosyltransferase, family 11 [Neorhizobium galegae bv. orientalis str. HAMBI 540]
MIITRILGGLGNQMFQYAAGRALAIANEAELKLDLIEMSAYKLRPFALDQFNIQAAIAQPDEVPSKSKRGLLRKFTSAFKSDRSSCERIVENGLAFDSKVPALRGSLHLSGYWQSEQYFASSADAIRSDFSLKSPLSPARQDVLALIDAATAPVSIHVRRGDYVTSRSANAVHGTCEPPWYHEAMRRMLDRAGEASFFVFSDEPQWARSNLQSSRPMVFIEPQNDGRDGEDMHLMAACHTHIIANSSFSWWGAWLNPRPDKYVIAPKQWFRALDKDDRDIVPANWERL